MRAFNDKDYSSSKESNYYAFLILIDRKDQVSICIFSYPQNIFYNHFQPVL